MDNLQKITNKYRNVFYIIQPHPSFPRELKLGRSKGLIRRLKTYRTICPNLKVLRIYRVNPRVEKPAINFLSTLPGCYKISSEVLQVNDTEAFLKACDFYFGKKRKTTRIENL